TPYDAALSEEPWPTIRTRFVPRSRAVAATRANSSPCSSSPSSARGCSRISARNWLPSSPTGSRSRASSDDTRLASHEHALDLEAVAQDDKIGGEVDVEPPNRRETEHGGRDRRRGSDSVGEPDSEGMQVSDGVDHRQHAARQDAVRPAHGAVAHDHLEAAEAVR